MSEDTTRDQEQQALTDQPATPKRVQPGPTPPESPIVIIKPHGCLDIHGHLVTFPPGPLRLQGTPNSAYLIGPICGRGVGFRLNNQGIGHWIPSEITGGGAVHVTNNSDSELRVQPG